MGIITFTQKAKLRPLELPEGFPKCVCGSNFRITDSFTMKGVHWGTSADCDNCGEHFFQADLDTLQRNIPKGQKARLTK